MSNFERYDVASSDGWNNENYIVPTSDGMWVKFDDIKELLNSSHNSAMDAIALAKRYAETRSGDTAYHTMWAFIEWVGQQHQ
jgi:hypothetical protein